MTSSQVKSSSLFQTPQWGYMKIKWGGPAGHSAHGSHDALHHQAKRLHSCKCAHHTHARVSVKRRHSCTHSHALWHTLMHAFPCNQAHTRAHIPMYSGTHSCIHSHALRHTLMHTFPCTQAHTQIRTQLKEERLRTVIIF